MSDDLTPVGSAAVRLALRTVRLRRERDRARGIAVALEQQVAALTSALNVALYFALTRGDSPDRSEALQGCAMVLTDTVAPNLTDPRLRAALEVEP